MTDAERRLSKDSRPDFLRNIEIGCELSCESKAGGGPLERFSKESPLFGPG